MPGGRLTGCTLLVDEGVLVMLDDATVWLELGVECVVLGVEHGCIVLSDKGRVSNGVEGDSVSNVILAGSNGWMPYFLNPFIIFDIVNAFACALLKSSCHIHLLTILFGLCAMNSEHTRL